MRLLLLPAVVIGLSTLVAFLFGDRLEAPESFEAAVVWLRSYDQWVWLVAMGAVIGDFILPLPSTPALVTLGIVYGPWWGGLLGGIATTTAGVLGFGLTRLLGRRGALFLVGERDPARAEGFYARWGVYAVAFGRAVGGPFEWLILIAGISGMPFARAFVAIAVGGLTVGFVTAFLGDMAVERPMTSLMIVVALVAVLAWFARRMLASESAAPPAEGEAT